MQSSSVKAAAVYPPAGTAPKCCQDKQQTGSCNTVHLIDMHFVLIVIVLQPQQRWRQQLQPTALLAFLAKAVHSRLPEARALWTSLIVTVAAAALCKMLSKVAVSSGSCCNDMQCVHCLCVLHAAVLETQPTGVPIPKLQDGAKPNFIVIMTDDQVGGHIGSRSLPCIAGLCSEQEALSLNTRSACVVKEHCTCGAKAHCTSAVSRSTAHISSHMWYQVALHKCVIKKHCTHAIKSRLPCCLFLQGWDDLGVNNPGNVHTPNLDKFMSRATRFDNFYVTPQCAQSRAALLTGRMPARVGTMLVHGGE